MKQVAEKANGEQAFQKIFARVKGICSGKSRFKMDESLVKINHNSVMGFGDIN